MCYTAQSELETQSPYSPGIVESAESLLRLGFSPEHIVDGEVISAAIKTNDLQTRGFSVYRERYTEPNHLRTLAERQGDRLIERTSLAQNPLLSVFSCSEVRQIVFNDACSEVEGNRAAVVLDNADRDNTAHAAIFSTSPRRRDVKWLKNRLLPILNNLIALEAHLNRVHSA